MRYGVVQPVAHSQDVRGVALLMRQGMVAWMRCVSDSDSNATSCNTTSTPAAACVPKQSSAIESMLVNIVAAMAMVHAREFLA
jgi:hypothetical protein